MRITREGKRRMANQRRRTVGAFGNQDGDPNAKRKVLKPRKLVPPPEIVKKIVSDDKRAVPRNPIVRFFRKFFSVDDGY